MALSIDGTASNITWSTANSGTVTLTTTNAGDIICILVGSESLGTPSATVSSITATGLTFAKRAAVVINTNTAQHFSMLELWWAYASAALTGKVITVNLDKTIDDAVIQAFGVTGFTGTTYQTAPWDQNASLPATATNTIDGAAAIINGISTTNAETMLIGAFGTVGGGLDTPHTGYTRILTSGNTGATNQFFIDSERSVVAATQSNVSVQYDVAPAIGWLGIADALSMVGGGAGGGVTTQKAITTIASAAALSTLKADNKRILVFAGQSMTWRRQVSAVRKLLLAESVSALKTIATSISVAVPQAMGTLKLVNHQFTAIVSGEAFSSTRAKARAAAASITSGETASMLRQPLKLLTPSIGESLTWYRGYGPVVAFSGGEAFSENVTVGKLSTFGSPELLTSFRQLAHIVPVTSPNTANTRRTMGKVALALTNSAISRAWSLAIGLQVLSTQLVVAGIGGGRTLLQLILIFQAQSDDPIVTFSKIIQFTTRLGGLQRVLNNVTILQAQAITLLKRTSRSVVMRQDGLIPAMGVLSRSTIQALGAILSAALLSLARMRGHAFPIVLSSTVTETTGTKNKVVTILSAQAVAVRRLISKILLVVSDFSSDFGPDFSIFGGLHNIVTLQIPTTKLIPKINSANTITSARQRSRLLIILSPESLATVRRSANKLIRWGIGQAIKALKPLTSLQLITQAQAVVVTIPQGRLQNILASILSDQALNTPFYAVSHFVNVTGISELVHVFQHAIDKRTELISNLLGTLSRASAFPGVTLNSSVNVSRTSFRQVIPLTAITTTNIGGQVSLTLSNLVTPSAGPCQVTSMWVGMQAATGQDYDFDGNQVQATVNGKSTFNLPLTTSIATDFQPFNLAVGGSLVVAIDVGSFAAGLDRTSGLADTGFHYWSGPYSSSSGNTFGPSGLTLISGALTGVGAIKTRTANMSVVKSVNKRPLTFSQSLAQTIAKLLPPRLVSIVSGQTVTTAAQRATIRMVNAALAQVMTGARSMSRIILYGYLFSPRTFTGQSVNSSVSQVIRQVIPGSQILTGTTNPVQVTLSDTGPVRDCQIIAAYIGEQGTAGTAEFDGNQQPLLVGGQASFIITGGRQVKTDPIALTVVGGTPLVVSFEVGPGLNAFDLLTGLDPGFVFWTGGPSGSAGNSTQPSAMTQQLGALGAVASVGVPQLVDPVLLIGKTIPFIQAAAQNFARQLGKKLLPLSPHQLRVGPSGIFKLITLLTAQTISVPRGVLRSLTLLHSSRVTLQNQGSPLFKSTIGQTLNVSNLRTRFISFASALAQALSKGAGKAVTLLESETLFVSEGVRNLFRVVTLLAPQVVSTTKALTKIMVVVQIHVQTSFQLIVKAPFAFPMGQTSSLRKSISASFSAPIRLTFEAGRGLGKRFSFGHDQAVSFFSGLPARFVAFTLTQANNMVLSLPGFAKKTTLTVRQSHAIALPTSYIRRIWRFINGTRGSRASFKGTPE